MNIAWQETAFYAIVSAFVVFILYVVFDRLDIGMGLSDRWARIDIQVNSIKKTSQWLTNRLNRSLSIENVVNISLKAIRTIYWKHMHNPLSRILLVGFSGSQLAAQGFPPLRDVLDEESRLFLTYLQATPSLSTARPFCGNDIERLLAYSLEIPQPENLVFINKFMMDHSFEFCFPCINQGQLFGAIFLGSKRRGIFWPQELRAFQMISVQMAASIEKASLVKTAEAALEKI